MTLELEGQRAYSMKQDQVETFLEFLWEYHRADNLIRMEAAHVLQHGGTVTIIVNKYGSYPFVENEFNKKWDDYR